MNSVLLKTLTRRRRKARGMTLIEIVVVIAIIGLLTAAVGIAVIPQFKKAQIDTARKNDMPAIMTGLKTYYLQKSKYPDTGVGLKALVDAQIVDKQPKDPWQNDYVYVLEGNKPIIKSYGPDGQAGTEDDISSNDDPNK
jgi:general secretion pathway protein G